MNFRMNIFNIMIVLIIFFLTSCCTIIHGTKQKIQINSNPPKANVFVNNKMTGSTPIKLKLKRKNRHIIRLMLDGYNPYSVTVTRKPTPLRGFYPLMLTIGLISYLIDYANGSVYDLAPNIINANLEKENNNHER